MREIFASIAEEGDGHVDLVISARPAAKDATFDALRAELNLALRKLGIAGS